jgi:hypothetical protein
MTLAIGLTLALLAAAPPEKQKTAPKDCPGACKLAIGLCKDACKNERQPNKCRKGCDSSVNACMTSCQDQAKLKTHKQFKLPRNDVSCLDQCVQATEACPSLCGSQPDPKKCKEACQGMRGSCERFCKEMERTGGDPEKLKWSK